LERSQVLTANPVAELRQAIQSAESSKLGKKDVKKLKKLASTLNKNAGATNNAADIARLQNLAEILKKPTV
jgi:uncharacterized protein with von Willebrand factor type A (vWA) domain